MRSGGAAMLVRRTIENLSGLRAATRQITTTAPPISARIMRAASMLSSSVLCPELLTRESCFGPHPRFAWIGLLRQAGLPQAFQVPGSAFGAAVERRDLGDRAIRFECAELLGYELRFLDTPELREARRERPIARGPACLLDDGLAAPDDAVLVLRVHAQREPQAGLHRDHGPVDRAQPDGAVEMRERLLLAPGPAADPAAHLIGRGGAWIEAKRAIEQHKRGVDVVREIADGDARHPEHARIVPLRLDGGPGSADGARTVPRGVGAP